MVWSHALFLPLPVALRLDELDSLVPYLSEATVSAPTLAPIEFEPPNRTHPQEFLQSLPPGVADLADGLLSGGKLPIVWPGQDGFDEAIFFIWRWLLPDLRHRFDFRLGFGTQDAHVSSLSALAVPQNLLPRWAGYRIVKIGGSEEPTESSALLLHQDTASKLRVFSEGIGARLAKPTDLKLLDQLNRYVHDGAGTLDETVAALRLFLHLCPLHNTGIEIRQQLIERLLREIRGGTSAQLRALRNIDFGAFPQEERVWSAISEWVQRNLFWRAGFAELVYAAVRSPDSRWTGAFWSGFDAALSNLERNGSAALWTLCEVDPGLAAIFLPRLPNTRGAEDLMVECCPKSLPVKLGDLVLEPIAKRSWFRLHAQVLSAIYGVEDALMRQLAVDRDPSASANILAILRDSSEEEILGYCLQMRDSRLTELAGEACGRRPALLAQFNAHDETWRGILASALGSHSDVFPRLPHPEVLVDKLLEATITSNCVSPALWRKIADTPLADLSRHPRREALWAQMPTEIKQLLLPKTVEGWLASFAVDSEFDSPEPELEAAILAGGRIARFLSGAIPGRIGIGSQLFLRLPNLGEAIFHPWLVEITERVRWLDADSSRSLGHIVAAKGWRRVAELIGQQVLRSRRHDLIPALRECHGLLGLVARMKLAFSGLLDAPHSDELWNFYEQTAIELYQKGPDQNSLWSRAGGSYADLPNTGSGRSRWAEAIRLLRRGGGGSITAHSLLETMRDDYSNNESVGILLGEKLFRNESRENDKRGWLL
jgi:hypothetical protein